MELQHASGKKTAKIKQQKKQHMIERDNSDEIDVKSFPIAPHVQNKLMTAGFKFVQDFAGVSPLDLSRECGITPQQAFEVLNFVTGADDDELAGDETLIDNNANNQQQADPSATAATSGGYPDSINNAYTISQQRNLLQALTHGAESALQLITKANENPPIPTFCKELDELLNGGIRLGTLTEFCMRICF